MIAKTKNAKVPTSQKCSRLHIRGDKQTKQAATLGELMQRANAAHDELMGLQRNALELAKRAGEALVAAKKLVKAKGQQWKPWVAEHFHGRGYETAAAYMRVYNRWDEIEPELVAEPRLTLDRALHHLRVEREPKDPTEKSIGQQCKASLTKQVSEYFTDAEAIFLDRFCAGEAFQDLQMLLDVVRARIKPLATTLAALEQQREQAIQAAPDDHAAINRKFARQVREAFKGQEGLSAFHRRKLAQVGAQ